MKVYISIFFTIVLSTANAGPWLKEKGKHYTQLSFAYMKASSLFHNFNPDPIQLHRDVSDHTLAIYSEYGLTNNFNLIAYLPYKFTGTDEQIFASNFFLDTLESGTLQGIGNASLTLKAKLIQNKYLLSAQLKTELPSANRNASKGLQTGFDAFTFYPALLFGRGWEKQYFAAEAGYRLRTNNFSDEFYGSIEYGYQLKSLYIIALIEARQSMFNKNRNDATFLQTGLFVNNQEYFSPGLKLNLELNKKYSLNAGLFGAFSGNYVMHFPSLNIGFAFQN